MMSPGRAVTTAALPVALGVPVFAAVFVVILGMAAGCSVSNEARPDIAGITPSVAFNDAPIALTIQGQNFRAAYTIDTSSGKAGVDDTAFSVFLSPVPSDPSTGLTRVQAIALDWQTSNTLVATLPAKIAVGVYDVGVRDPRGHLAFSPQRFVSLGPDTLAPLVAVDQPPADTIVGAETVVSGQFHADDGNGILMSLTWSVYPPGSASGTPIETGSCPVSPGPGYGICPFQFTGPIPDTQLEALSFEAKATDSQGLTSTAVLTLALARRPTVTSLDPSHGPTVGGTLVTLQGTDFVEALGAPETGTQILIDGQPIEMTIYGSSTVISGFTQAHLAGPAPVSVRTGGAPADAGAFLFVAPPIVRAVSPIDGSAAGGTWVTIAGNNFRQDETQIFFEDPNLSEPDNRTPLSCQTFISEHRIEGYAPPGAGTMTVVAVDPIGGEGRLEAAFSYDDDAGAGGLPADAGCPALGITP